MRTCTLLLGLAATALASSSSSVPASRTSNSTGRVPSLPPGTKNSTAGCVQPHPRPGFVSSKDGKLWLDGKLFDFRTMNAPNLLNDPVDVFENVDTFLTFAALGTPASRTYVLASVGNSELPGGMINPNSTLIQGWDEEADDWVYNEQYLEAVDEVLEQARTFGVKLIVPLVNEDYGTEDTDYAGNFNDLIRLRFDIPSYTEAQQIDWFTNMTIREDFKKIIHKCLSRKNTLNGIVWGHDDTILAWETGNEMNQASVNASNQTVHERPAPANWTIDIAETIKSLAPNTLVMDGSFARVYNTTEAWPVRSLESPHVDLFSYHFYGDGDIPYFQPFAERVRSFGKTFIIGEHGFYSGGPAWGWAYGNLTSDIAGAGVWSMRPHSSDNGFITHSEGGGIYSYHFPGWSNSSSPDFEHDEINATHLTYSHSFTILGQNPPPYPIPDVPLLKDASNATATGVTWRGATWAEHYELWAASLEAPFFQPVGLHLHDNVDAGTLFIPVEPSSPTHNITYSPPAAPQPTSVTWTDPKWDGEGTFGDGHSKRDVWERRATRPTQIPIEAKVHETRSHAKSSSTTSSSDPGISVNVNVTADWPWDFGTWYLVRGVSVNGIPGPFSNPVFIPA